MESGNKEGIELAAGVMRNLSIAVSNRKVGGLNVSSDSFHLFYSLNSFHILMVVYDLF